MNKTYITTKSTYTPVKRKFKRTIIHGYIDDIQNNRISALPEYEVGQYVDEKEALQVLKRFYGIDNIKIQSIDHYEDEYTLSIPKLLEHATKKTKKLKGGK